MMDKRPKKELIDGIRDFLHDFEEPYDHREWEQFRRQRRSKNRKPIPLAIKLAGVAASLFLMVYASVRFLPFFDRVDDAGKNMPKDAPYPIKEPEQHAKDTLTMDSVPPTDHPNEVHGAPGERANTVRLPDLTPDKEIQIPTVTAHANDTGLMSGSGTIGEPTKKTMLQTVSPVRGWGTHRKPPHAKAGNAMRINFPNLWPGLEKRTSFDDIRIGFNVNPVITGKGVAIGGGVSAQIPLTSRIATEIGVNYANVRVGVDMEADKTDTVSLQTIGIRNAVGMVGIPVSLNYTISESFSASLAVTPFRVIADRRTDILESYRWANGDISSGDTSRRLVAERTRSRRADSLYMGNTYLGFIQVSGLISPPFLRRHHAVIAPFVAIPIGKLRNEEYSWLHGGISFRIYVR